jgi:hypothetical protein
MAELSQNAAPFAESKCTCGKAFETMRRLKVGYTRTSKID